MERSENFTSRERGTGSDRDEPGYGGLSYVNMNDHMHVSRLLDCHPHSSASPSHLSLPSEFETEKRLASVPGVRVPCGVGGKKKKKVGAS
jgi:hypothetical protein